MRICKTFYIVETLTSEIIFLNEIRALHDLWTRVTSEIFFISTGISCYSIRKILNGWMKTSTLNYSWYASFWHMYSLSQNITDLSLKL